MIRPHPFGRGGRRGPALSGGARELPPFPSFEKKCGKRLDIFRGQWYNDHSYTTDGSGMNHMKYNGSEPTVWAFHVRIVSFF